MKALKMVMVIVIAVSCILPVLAVNQAQAAAVWVDCYVNLAGQGSYYKYVQLTDATGTGTPNHEWFLLSDSFGGARDMLTTALSAMVSGMKITAYVSPGTPYRVATTLYLMDK
jgi:hypothetical protein